MDRIFNRFLSLLMVAAMLFALLPQHIHADPIAADTHDHKDLPSSGLWINPQLSAGDIERPQKDKQVTPQSIDVTLADVRKTLEEAAATVRDGMVARQETVSVTFPVNADFDATDIWNAALMHTGDPKQGDYILGQLHYYSWDAYYSTISGAGYYTYVFEPGYFTTAAQEQQVDEAVAALLDQLDLWDASDHDKIKGIYDWICSNVTYDYENLNDKNYLLKHSAYAALINKTAVCQGYAVLFYRLALELGVDARLISGTSGGDAHAWNIAKIGALYYNLDATWDAASVESGTSYEYFLCGSGNFADHARAEDYDSAEFHQAYPMSPEAYGNDISWPVSGTCGEDLTWTLDESGTLTVSGTGAMYDYYAEDPQWYDYVWNIRRVVISEQVDSVGAFAFYQCYALTDVQILGATILAESAFSYCEQLTTVSMLKAIALADSVFEGSGLTSVHIPSSMLQIGNLAFYGCVGLQELTVDPGNLYYTAESNVLFNKDMSHLYVATTGVGESYAIPDSVVLISDYAFFGNPGLRFVTVGSSVKALPEGVFYACAALESVALPSTLETICDFAFYSCESLLQISLPENLTHIGFFAFSGTGLNAVTFPGNLKTIADSAFMDCQILSVINFRGNAPTIGDDAFGNVFADVYYPNPDCDPSWESMQQDYGGYLVWHEVDTHSYSAVVTEPTCEARGYTTYTCSCGIYYVDDYVDPLGHAWDNGVITKIPTEEESGTCVYTCTVCGASRTEVLPPQTHEHSYTQEVTLPTCTEQGYTTYTCACGHSYLDEMVPALGHSYVPTVTAPTCEKQGHTTYTCSRCSDSYVDDEVAPLGHSFTDYQSDHNATCTQNGTMTAYCDHGCGNTDTVEEINTATGHTFAAWMQNQAPTCTEPGAERRDCESCDHFETRDVAPTGHIYSQVITDPTCTKEGFTTHTCHCGHSYIDSVVPASGHEMGPWQTVTPPTMEHEGLKRRQCLRCEYAEEEVIPVITGPTQILSDIYNVTDALVSKIPAETKAADFLSGFEDPGFIKLVKDGAEVPADAYVATGMEVQLIVSDVLLQKLTVVVTGDINGDGSISITDMLAVKSHILKKSLLEGVKALAADTSGDGAISITDFLQIKAQILNRSAITPHKAKRFRLLSASEM